MSIFFFAASTDHVAVWDFVEVTATTAEIFPANLNPFSDIVLYGIFIDPTGDSTTVMGFCDAANGSCFRVRFMPQYAGAHEYRLTLSVRGEVVGVSRGTFTAQDDPERLGPVARDPEHPWHFRHRGSDRHFFQNGTTAYLILGLSDDAMIRALDRLQRHGVNRIRFALSMRVVDGTVWDEPVYTRDDFSFRLNPWVAENPDSVEAPGWDVTRFNLAFWQKAERLLAVCRERDIVASAIFYVDGARPGVDPFDKENAGGDNEMRYYAYAAARFAAFANIQWDVSNEYRLFRDEAWVNRMASFLKACDPYKHALSVHGHRDFRFYGASWCDYACYQSWDEHGGYAFMIQNRALQTASGVIVPQVNEEYGYEDHYPRGWGEARIAPARDADTRRRIAWEIAMAGGYQTTGESAPPLGGWLNGLAPDDHTAMLDGNHRIRKFFTTFAWWKFRPAPEVLGAGSAKAYCLADDDDSYVFWLPEGGKLLLQLGQGTYRASWFDPRTDAGFGEPFLLDANTASASLLAPEDTDSPPQDWALSMERAGSYSTRSI